MYYLRSRYYNPELGRFINADTIIRGNLFSYCKSSPIAYHCKDDSIYSYKVLDERGHRVCNYLQSFASYTNEIPDPLYVVAYKEDQEVNRICLRRKGNIWKIEE